MTSTDKTKLDGIAENANNYSLPSATDTTLGGVRVGSNITNNDTKYTKEYMLPEEFEQLKSGCKYGPLSRFSTN